MKEEIRLEKVEAEKSMEETKLYRKTPLMGWASWNCFRTHISEELLKKQARALVDTGLAACGYTYLNIDDGFFGGRDEAGQVMAHEKRFPNGMKALADAIHGLGLKAGIYAEGGDNTCGFYYDREGGDGEGVGLYQHEEADLHRYLSEWGYDFIKVDWCGGIRLGLDNEEQYTKIGRIIDRIRHEEKRCLVYNICRWQFPGPWAAELADSWRTGADISPDFDSVMHQLDMLKPLRRFCRPGHVNDPDMLQVGNGMSREEDEAHFAMWCMVSAPLMIGCDLTGLSEETLALLMNRELIAIQQDPACLQAFVVREIREKDTTEVLSEDPPAAEIWVKDLGEANSREKAVAFLNRSRESLSLSATAEELGLSQIREVRDVLTHRDLPAGEVFRLTLAPHSCLVYRIRAKEARPVQEIAEPLRSFEVKKISCGEAAALAAAGAQLVDVRSRQEYERGHVPSALHVPYMEIHALAGKLLPDRKQKLVLYCHTGKRSSQAAKSLLCLGYQDVCYYVCPPDSFGRREEDGVRADC